MYAAAASCPLRLFLIGDIVSPWSQALGAASCPLRLLLSATSCRRGAQRWGRHPARCIHAAAASYLLRL